MSTLFNVNKAKGSAVADPWDFVPGYKPLADKKSNKQTPEEIKNILMQLVERDKKREANKSARKKKTKRQLARERKVKG